MSQSQLRDTAHRVLLAAEHLSIVAAQLYTAPDPADVSAKSDELTECIERLRTANVLLRLEASRHAAATKVSK